MSRKKIFLLGMLVFVPIAFVSAWLKLHPFLVFFTSGLAIVPLAAIIADSTEAVADVIGPSLGGLLNVTFGNATELIVSIVALRAGLVEVVKASITGAIVTNLLLGLGAAILLGGLKLKEQSFQPTIARINASSLILALVVLLGPTAIVFTSTQTQVATINHFSIVAALLLLAFYGLTFVFSMRTHKHIYELGAAELGETSLEELAVAKLGGIWRPIGVLFCSTIVLVFVSDTLVSSLEQAISSLGLTNLFTGVILIPIFGGAVEFITASTFALKNKMDLAMAVAMGSSLQIAMFVAPVLVIVGQLMGQPMNLNFNPFEVLAIAIAVTISNSISTDGKSNWLEGALLLIAYTVVGAAFYFHP